MRRGRRSLLLATSTLLSVALAVAVNVATGGSLPGPLNRVQWLAWPLVAALAVAVAVLGMWQDGGSHPARTRVVARPAELPPDVGHLVGREADLAALLRPVPKRPPTGLGAPVVIGVFGTGGTGKTVLATRLAHLVAARYPDGQLFVELRGASPRPADPGEVLRRLLHALGVAPTDVPEDLDARQALYRSVLAERRVLVYLDDAGSTDQVRPLLPAGSGCLVLVTARPSLVGLRLAAWRNLGVLSDEAVLDLLGSSAGEGRLLAEPDAAAEVVRHCGHLPLALAVAGARLRNRPQWTLADLARRLADERRRLDELHAGNLDVRASIGLSYAELDPLASRLFRLLGVLGYASFGPGVAAALLGGSQQWPASEDALERLADAKLVELAGPRRYRFHDLVRLFAQERLEAEEPPDQRKAALLRSLEYYLRRTHRQWDTLTDASSDQGRRAEAEQWFERSRSAIVAAVQRAEEAGELEMVWRLAAAIAPYLEARAYPADLAAVATPAVRAARRLGNRDALATALRNLGQAERHRSRHERSLAVFTESLALREQLGQDGHVAEILHRIGNAYQDLGRYAEAEAAYLRAIEIFHGLGQSNDEALVQVSLATTWLLAGRTEQAIPLVEDAVERLGLQDPDLEPDRAGAWALEALGAAWKAGGRVAEARRCHERSLASFSAREERYGSAYALLNLARCEASLGNLDQARERYTESLRLFTQIGSTDGQRSVSSELAALARTPAARRPRRSRVGRKG